MTEQEKREKVVKHIAKRNGYIIKLLIAIVVCMVFFKLALDADNSLVSILCFTGFLVSGMAVMCFKVLHQGMLYCPLCGTSFGYGSWMTGTMPYRCPHCGEKLSY